MDKKMKKGDVDYYLKRFVEISFLYEKLMMDPEWNRTKNFNPEKNLWESISLFLENYAFERNVRVEKYKTASLKIISDLKKNNKNLLEETSKDVWNEFKKKLKNKNLNHKNNPLCPRGTEYPTKEKGGIVKRKVKDLSIIEFVTKVLKNENPISWCKEKIEKNKIKEARDSLKDINGIGDKIASFFLRDVFVRYFEEKDFSRDERILLQPIDKWIRLIVQKLSSINKKTDTPYAEWIVEFSKTIGLKEPEKFNQGAWFFCAQIAYSSEPLIDRCFNNKELFECLVTDYIKNPKTNSEIAEKFEKEIWERH